MTSLTRYIIDGREFDVSDTTTLTYTCRVADCDGILDMLTKPIRVKLHDGGTLPRRADGGDWYDLFTCKDVSFTPGDFKLVSLGVSIELPEGYEAIIAPRSSTFKKYGLLQANSIGVVDCSYNGDDDVWCWAAYATKAVDVPAGTRLCQFRIQRIQPEFSFKIVDSLGNDARGGFGSTGD